MAVISFDNSAQAQKTSGDLSTLTYSYTVGSGSNRILFVGVFFSSVSDPLSSGTVTYAGSAMTQVSGSPVHFAFSWLYLYYILNPTSGANNIVITGVGASGVGISSVAASYAGASQSGQPDNTTTGNVPSGPSITLSLTPANDSDWTLFLTIVANAGGIMNAGTNVTQRQQDATFGTLLGDSNGAISPPVSYSMTGNVNGGSNQNIGAIMVSFSNSTLRRTNTASIMNGASRSATVKGVQSLLRSVSASIMNSASRLTTLTKGFTRSISVSIMNAASRFVSFIVRINGSSVIWAYLSKNSTSWGNQTRNSDTFVNQAKSSTSFSNLSKSSTSWQNGAKSNSSNWVDQSKT